MQSGTVLHPNTIVKDGRKVANELADQINCPKNSSQLLIECLRQLDANELTKVAENYKFGFSIESRSENTLGEMSLPDEPLKLLESGALHAVPSLHGVTSAEQLVTAMEFILTNENSSNIGNNDEFVANLLNLAQTPNSLQMASDLNNHYFRGWNLTRDELLHNLTNLQSDRDWIHPLSTYINFQIQREAQRPLPIYLYYFSKPSNYTYVSPLKEEWGNIEIPFGVSHNDDLQYILPSYKYPTINPGSPFYNFSKSFIKTLVQFVTTGNLTNNGWESLDIENTSESNGMLQLKWYEINDEPKMFTPYGLEERMDVWNKFKLEDLYI